MQSSYFVIFKIWCHYSVRKNKLFFDGKNGFSWGTPLRAAFVIIIIMLVEKKDIYKMSKLGQAKHTFQIRKMKVDFTRLCSDYKSY